MARQRWLGALAVIATFAVFGCDSSKDDDDSINGGERGLARPEGEDPSASKQKEGERKPDEHKPDEQKPDERKPVVDPPSGDDGNDGTPTNPCAAVTCPQNSRCEAKEVQCIRAPCPPVAECVPIAPTPARDAGSPKPARDAGDVSARCATVLCRAGTRCIEEGGSAQCVPVATCAATLCEVGSSCVETPLGAECVPADPCAKHRCSAGSHCEAQAVQCIRAPCPSAPVCVPDVDACAAVRCRAGTHCEVKQVQCIRAPCPPVAECVAD